MPLVSRSGGRRAFHAAGARWPPSGSLGELEATEEADQTGGDAGRARRRVTRGHSQYASAGRTSTAPPYLKAGVCAASSSAGALPCSWLIFTTTSRRTSGLGRLLGKAQAGTRTTARLI